MLIYITGGVRSGKSRFAVEWARKKSRRVVFVATSWASDVEMRHRIQRHRRERPRHWTTLENVKDLARLFSKIPPLTEVVLLDCLSLFVAGRLTEGEKESRIYAQVESFWRAAARAPFTILVVSNEVGSGLVPVTDMGRKFQDYTGRANQIAARYAETAYLMVSGLPMILKESEK